MDGKELLHHAHAHGQGLPKTPGAGKQSHCIPILPPLFDKACFIYKKALILPYKLKALSSD